MKYALNLSDDKRILSACVVLPGGNYAGMHVVDELPTGETDAEKDITNWRFRDDVYVYDPLPEPEPPEPTPTLEQRVEVLEQKVDGELADQQEALNLLGVYV